MGNQLPKRLRRKTERYRKLMNKIDRGPSLPWSTSEFLKQKFDELGNRTPIEMLSSGDDFGRLCGFLENLQESVLQDK